MIRFLGLACALGMVVVLTCLSQAGTVGAVAFAVAFVILFFL